MIELVVNAVKQKKFQLSQERRKFLSDLHLASVVKANLMRFPKNKAMDIEVTADSSSWKVVISGNFPPGDISIQEKDMRSTLSGINIIKDTEIKLK